MRFHLFVHEVWVSVIPLDSVEVARRDGILDPEALGLTLAEGSSLEIGISSITLENNLIPKVRFFSVLLLRGLFWCIHYAINQDALLDLADSKAHWTVKEPALRLQTCARTWRLGLLLLSDPIPQCLSFPVEHFLIRLLSFLFGSGNDRNFHRFHEPIFLATTIMMIYFFVHLIVL